MLINIALLFVRDKKMLLKLEKDFLGFISDPRYIVTMI